MAWAGFVALVCKMRNTYNILDGKLEGKRSVGRPRNTYTILNWKLEGKRAVGRPRLRWGDNIKTDL
jgi:hypothetical protein